jgi:DNA-binding response OmpR family regulator
MALVPDVSRIPRIIFVERKLAAAQPVLAHLANAGLDCRYLPPDAATVANIQEVNPHIIVLSVLSGQTADAEARSLSAQLRRVSNVPIVIITHAAADLSAWRNLQLGGVCYVFATENLPQAVLERVAERLERIYHETTLLQVAEERSRGGGVTQPLRQGWHTCYSCGYLGPRAKFINTDKASHHTLRCPACHNTDAIEFSVAGTDIAG